MFNANSNVGILTFDKKSNTQITLKSLDFYFIANPRGEGGK
jgi:hypothetical protein